MKMIQGWSWGLVITWTLFGVCFVFVCWNKVLKKPSLTYGTHLGSNSCRRMWGIVLHVWEADNLATAQVLQGVNLTSNICNVSADSAAAGSTDESTSLPLLTPLSLWHTQTHTPLPFLLLEWKEVRVERRRTVKASCPERAHTRICECAHTHNLNACPPSLH